MTEKPPITILETFNYDDYPVGGQQTFAKQLALVYPGRANLVGVTTGEEPVGIWTTKQIGPNQYPFFAFGKIKRSHSRPLVPRRLVSYLMIRRFKAAILRGARGACFVQAPEILMATSAWSWPRLCFRFAGTENSLGISRYAWARVLGGRYEKRLFRALGACDLILASGDHQAIRELVARSHGLLGENQVIKFPTRVDTKVFFPRPIPGARSELGIPAGAVVLVANGRIAKVKGYELLVESFGIVRDKLDGRAHLYFVGDGEDRQDLEAMIAKNKIQGCVHLEGFQTRSVVASFLNAADVVVVGSRHEGWSTAMLEALACGKPIVSTAVSGAKDLIVEGVNGYVLDSRDPHVFAGAVLKALTLECPNSRSIEVAQRYSLQALSDDLDSLLNQTTRK